MLGNASGDNFGARVQVLADQGVDGCDELLISAPDAPSTSGQADAGNVAVFLGSVITSGLSEILASEAALTIYGEDANDRLTLAGPLHDLDGDGRDDWLASSPTHADVKVNEGKVYLFLSDN